MQVLENNRKLIYLAAFGTEFDIRVSLIQFSTK